MFSIKRDLTSYQDVVTRMRSFLKLYSPIVLFTLLASSGFHSGFVFAVSFDYISHLIHLWVFKNKFVITYPLSIWLKKFFMIPWYHLVLGSQSHVPIGAFIMMHLLLLTICVPVYASKRWKLLYFLPLVINSGISMSFFSKASYQFIFGVAVVTFYFVFFILNLLESVTELLDKIQSQSSRYKNLVDLIHCVFITTDENMTINFANNGFLDFKQGDLIGQNLKNFPFHNSQIIKQLKKSKQRQKYEWKTLNTDGQLLWYTIDASIQFSNSNEKFEIALLIQDVSLEKRMAEKEMINIQNIASLKAKNEFIASISHEIRNPLQVISYNSENLLTKNLTTEVKETVKDIHNSTKFLTTIVGDILDHSKIEAGEMKIFEKEFDLLEIVENSITMNYKSCFKKGLKMNLTFDYSLPKLFFGDSSRILQIMNNFISNSIKYTNEGFIQVEAKKIHSDNDSENFYFSCQDTGIGISKENLEHLFDPFIQIHQKKYSPSKFKGWGLGLSICRKLLTLMNGEFGVESNTGIGSKFWFTIPFTKLQNNLNYDVLLKDLDVNIDKISVIHSDSKVVNQIVNLLKMTSIPKIQVNSRNFCENQLILAENPSKLNIPEDFTKVKIVEISKESTTDFQHLKYPILPSQLLKLLSKPIITNETLKTDRYNENLKILIVDDNALILKSLERLLENLEIKNIQKATNGKEAYEIITQNDCFDIVFMDVSMPIMNGIECTQLIRELENEKKSTLVYALTGNVLAQSVEKQAKEWKFDQILSKPVKKSELQKILKNL